MEVVPFGVIFSSHAFPTFYVSIFLTDGHTGCSQFFAILNHTVMSILVLG